MHSGAFIPNQQQHLHGISWSPCFAILLPQSWSLPELVEVNILRPTESICSTNPSLNKNILRSHAAYPSSPSMESLRVPGTMVMDSTNAGTRAPIMSRLEDFSVGRLCNALNWMCRLSLLESPNSACSVRTPRSTGRGRLRSKLLFKYQEESTKYEER